MSAIAERPDGTRVHFMPYPTPIKDANGKVIGAVNMLVDITEQKVAEETQARLAAIVEQSDDAIVSKSLDGVIQTWNRGAERMFGYCAEEAVGRHITLIIPEERRAEEDMVLRKVRQLRRLVDDLLNVARITSGKLTLRKEPLELRDFAERAIGDYRALVPKGTSIVVAGAEAWVDADPVRLKQMIENLLDNATKYGGSNITVTVSAEERGARLAVQDDGQGIAPDLQAQLFQPFVQGAQPADREQRGLGLGLALAERLVSLHGGSVVAASDGLGKGSTFTISLPLAKPAASAERRKAQVASKHRVLVVEDEADSRECLKLLLETEGHEVALSDNAAAALEEIARFRPDIALVDVGLPGMDGYELARRARTLPGGKKLKLIAIP